MRLGDFSNGPAVVILWIIFAFLLLVIAILLSGHGENLIAGYNTLDKEEKKKYDEKKLRKTVAFGLMLIALLLLPMALFLDSLPSWFPYAFILATVADVIAIIIVADTNTKK